MVEKQGVVESEVRLWPAVEFDVEVDVEFDVEFDAVGIGVPCSAIS